MYTVRTFFRTALAYSPYFVIYLWGASASGLLELVLAPQKICSPLKLFMRHTFAETELVEVRIPLRGDERSSSRKKNVGWRWNSA